MAERPPVLLLPGLLCDASVWTHQQAALAAASDVRIPDFWGFDSITAMAESVLDHVTGPFDLVGHSMGGRVALEVMRLAPERVRRLVLMDTGVHPQTEGEPARRQAMIDLAWREGMAALAARWLPPMVHPDRTGDAALIEPLAAMVCRATPEIHEKQIRALLGRPDAAPVLETIACPTLVLCGRQDAWSPFPRHEEIAARIRGAELVPIEESGHMVTVERPEPVSAALVRFLGAGA